MEFVRRLLLKSFDIRKGEFVPALLLLLNIFLIILVYIILKPTVSALFLSKFGVQQLPYAFILVALFAGIVSLFYSKILLKISLNKLVLYTNTSSVCIMLSFGVLLQLGIAESFVLYAFYIWLSIFAVLATSQFWMLSNIIFSVREAKRLFGLIGAGAIAGGILGGYLASILAKLISSDNIVFVAAGLLLLCLPITKYLWKWYVEKKLNSFQQTKRLTRVVSNPFSIVKKSKYLSLIAGIVGLAVIVSKLVDYQFSSFVISKIKDPDELTAFFGFWFSTFNLFSLAIQLFVTRRIIGVYGVGASLLVLPIGISIATLFLMFMPVLWVAVFLQLNDASLKNSLNRSAVELLSLPIPLEIKSRVKTFIDVFVDRGATGIAGILLIFVIKGLHLPAIYINILIILLIVFWVYLASKIRLEYIKSFQEKLTDPKDDAALPLDLSKKSVFDGIIGVLNNGSESQVLYMLEKTYEMVDQRLFSSIQSHLKHPSGKVREAALNNLYHYRSPMIIDEIKAMLSDNELGVKIKVMEYLIARSSPDERVALVKEFIENSDPGTSSTALVTLAIQSKNNLEWQRIFQIRDRISEKIIQLDQMAEGVLKNAYLLNIIAAIGHARIEDFYSFLKEHFTNEDKKVVSQTIIAAGNSINPLFIPQLLENLLNNDQRNHSATALANYGEGLIKSLEEIVSNVNTDIELVRRVPLVVERIGFQASIDFLFKLLSFEDVRVRLEALRSMNKLKIEYPFLKINNKSVVKLITKEANLYLKTLAVLYNQNLIEEKSPSSDNIIDARRSLTNILEARLDGTLERIFRLIGLKYPSEEILPVFDGIRTKDSDFRTNAIEYLDNLLELDLKKILMPIIETALMDEVSKEIIESFNVDKMDDVQCFTSLMEGYDVKIKLAIFHLIGQLKEQRFLPLVKQYVASENKKVRDFAQKTADELVSIK